MNRRDIKTKNKIAIADTDADEELKPLHVQRGFKESDSNGLNKNFENIRERVNIPVKLSVVGSTKSGIWRRERIRMTDQEMDDVAFLTGAENTKGTSREPNIAVCSQKRALCVTATVLGALLAIALLIAYAGPQDCPCAGKMPKGYSYGEHNSTEKFEPYATNGQIFPWLLPFLPSNIRPTRYTILIHPNLTTLEVKGQVTIEFYVEKEMSFIVLHAQNLNITEKALLGPKGFSLKITRMLEYVPRQQIYIEFRDKLRKKSNYSLSLRWYSKLNYDPEGFYVDEYDLNGEKKLLAAAVLGPGRARKAFPCFDEPHLRANFKISLFRDRFHIGLSNSIVHATDDVGFYMGKSLLRDDFVETPPLSPDSISWMISVFKREFLESSLTYQTTTTTTSIPVQSLTSASRISDSLINSDKMLRRNMTSILKAGLSIKMTKLNNENHSHQTVTQKSENQLKNDNQSSIFLDDGIIRTAPSYTFYAPENILTKTRYLLHTSRNILEHLQNWLNVPFPFSKLDFVALPSIEENLHSSLGLILCKTAFLRDSNNITSYEYQRAAIEISEAILKQYFGGMISPKLWKQNWLWDGIIRYLSRLILAPLEPNWSIEEMYLMETKLKALDIDILQGWESVLNGTDDMGENNEFYIDKSAAILEVLHASMGEENFRNCMGSFITTYKYMTAEPNDLFQICSKKSNGSKNIKEIMLVWTSQLGYPLVTVKKINSTVMIEQNIFKMADIVNLYQDSSFEQMENVSETTTVSTTTTTSAPKDKKKGNGKWIFPVYYITANKEVKGSLWLDSLEAKIHLKENVKWIKLNADQNGFYRVLYDKETLNEIISQLKIDHTTFSTKDRMGLISDSFALCHSNLLDCNLTLELTSYLPKEKNYGPMVVAIKHFEKWRRILKYTECYLLLTEYMKITLAKSVKEIGWNDSGADELRLTRPQILLASVLWENPDSVKEAKFLLHSHLMNGTKIPPNLREVAYVGAMLSGDLLYWQYCYERYVQLRNGKDNLEERIELLRALGVTKDAWLQNRLLTFVMTLPISEIIPTLEAISSTPTGGAMSCRFLQAKWFDLQKRFGKGSLNFAKIINAITRYGANKFDYDELKSLVDRFGDGPGIQLLTMNLRTVAANVEWMSKSHITIFNWVESNLS